jgi:hypothetical protein
MKGFIAYAPFPDDSFKAGETISIAGSAGRMTRP